MQDAEIFPAAIPPSAQIVEPGRLEPRLLDPPRDVGHVECPLLLWDLVLRLMQRASLMVVDGSVQLAGQAPAPGDAAGLHQRRMERVLPGLLGAVPAAADKSIQMCMHGAHETLATAGARQHAVTWDALWLALKGFKILWCIIGRNNSAALENPPLQPESVFCDWGLVILSDFDMLI